jgi:hypothetical protein
MAAPVETSPELAHTREQGLAPDPLDAELVLLGAAQEALQAGRPTQALALAQQHAFRFPRGALANERRAVHALSLCALGRRAAARQVAADLAHSAPDAPVRKRIEADCGF